MENIKGKEVENPMAFIRKGLFVGQKDVLVIVKGGKFDNEAIKGDPNIGPDGLYKCTDNALGLVDIIKELQDAGYEIFFQ
jgi:hypothetical protein